MTQTRDNSTVFIKLYGMSDFSFSFHNTALAINGLKQNLLTFYIKKKKKKGRGLKRFPSFLTGLDESG